MNIICFDVETRNNPTAEGFSWNEPDKLGFASGVAYFWPEDVYFIYDQYRRLNLMNDINKSDIVVGFNLDFDFGILQFKPNGIHIFDICTLAKEISQTKGNSLANISQKTIGKTKLADGAEAPTLYRKKLYGELYSYNLHDVRLTWKLFQWWLSYGWIKNGSNTKIKLPKEWKHLKELEFASLPF